MRFRKQLVLLLVLTIVSAALPAKKVFAITAMSVTGTNITSNSSAVDTTVTPTVNFTLATALTVDGNTIQITLNGMDVSAGQTLAVADLTLTGCTTTTLEASPGTNDNGSHEVTITNGASGNSNPVILITLDSNTGTPPSCGATAKTLAIAASQVESSATAANYAINITTSSEAAAFLYYVGDENDVQIQATVDSILTFVIRNAADSGDQANVNGAAIGPNLCNLGNLSTASVQTCDYRLKITTNAASGYSVTIQTDGSLRKGTDFIPNQAEGTTVTGGTAGYAIALAGGSYDPDGAGSTFTPTACTEAGDFNDDDTPTATALAAGINTTLYTCNGPNAPVSTDTTNTALVTHRAEADSSSSAGSYTQLVTYTVSATF